MCPDIGTSVSHPSPHCWQCWKHNSEQIQTDTRSQLGGCMTVCGGWDMASYLIALWLADLNIDWETVWPLWILGNLQCINGSHDQWEFPLLVGISTIYQRPLTAPLHSWNGRLPLGLCKGAVKESRTNCLGTNSGGIYMRQVYVLINTMEKKRVVIMPTLSSLTVLQDVMMTNSTFDNKLGIILTTPGHQWGEIDGFIHT